MGEEFDLHPVAKRCKKEAPEEGRNFCNLQLFPALGLALQRENLEKPVAPEKRGVRSSISPIMTQTLLQMMRDYSPHVAAAPSLDGHEDDNGPPPLPPPFPTGGEQSQLRIGFQSGTFNEMLYWMHLFAGAGMPVAKDAVLLLLLLCAVTAAAFSPCAPFTFY